MSDEVKRLNVSKQVTAYDVTINTAAFQYKKCPLKERTQRQYLLHYWQKFGMDQKHIIPSCEDRLSELTTQQIDRIIDMEKIKSVLYDKKNDTKEIYFEYDSDNPNIHPNVFQANFIAKINALAIKRNLHHQNSNDFDEQIVLERSLKKEEKKIRAVPYKFVKKYRIDDMRNRRIKTQYKEEESKSIESIEDNYESFQQTIKERRTIGQCLSKRQKKRKEEFKLIPSRRWFYGMSTHYLTKNQQSHCQLKHQVWKSNYDIQGQLRTQKGKTFYEKQTKGKERSTWMSQSERKVSQPFNKFKTNRLSFLK